MTPFRAWRIAAGFRTAEEAARAFNQVHSTPVSVGSWKCHESSNALAASFRTRCRIARFLGVGDPLRLVRDYPPGMEPETATPATRAPQKRRRGLR